MYTLATVFKFNSTYVLYRTYSLLHTSKLASQVNFLPINENASILAMNLLHYATTKAELRFSEARFMFACVAANNR